MVLLDANAFLTELTKMYRDSTASGSVVPGRASKATGGLAQASHQAITTWQAPRPGAA